MSHAVDAPRERPHALSTPDRLIDAARRLPAFDGLVRFAREGGAGRAAGVRGLSASAPAWLTAALHRTLGGTFVWVLADGERAEEMREDLEYFLGKDRVLPFPEPEILPYDHSSPHPAVTAQRLETLAALARGERGVVVTTLRAIAQKVLSSERLTSHELTLHVGRDYDRDELLARLVGLGYERVPIVSALGQFSVRGGLLDLFSLGSEDPWRLEFEDETLVSLRRFDPLSQRSVEQMREATVLPRYEIALSPGEAAEVLERLAQAGDRAAEAAAREGRDIERMTSELFFEGMERVAGHYGQDLTSFWSYVPEDALVWADEPERLAERGERLDQDVERFHAEAVAHFPLVSPPSELFERFEDALAGAGARPRLERLGPIARRGGETPDPELVFSVPTSPQPAFTRNLDLVRGFITDLHAKGHAIEILCDNTGQRDRLEELLEPVPARLDVGLLAHGFTCAEAGFALLTDHEIFERYRKRVRRRKKTGGLSLAELNALDPGDYVVHEDHGIGIYRGLQRLTMNAQETDCLEIAYGSGDKLFVPVSQLSLVSKWTAEEGSRPPVHRLGSTSWAKTKAKARKAIEEMAGELLRTYALRRAMPGHAFGPDTVWQRELEASFIYDETPDQERAIGEVKSDMESARPMDRLVCGDVGYGKTEVAVRASFKAVMDHKQVAVLVPTTILAQQHFDTFRERLADYPVKVEMLSRFRTPKQQKETVDRTAAGGVDILIGTHRILSKDVRFRDLGLVVIDEEQRFGVAHKERLRKLRTQVDVLTLTATPIPRTLNFSLAGARDMSLIETPPKDRLPIHTEIVEYSEELIADALLRELDRGGQAFFVHNRVESITTVAALLERLLPQMRFGVAHGQMREHELERVMLKFLNRDLDCLVSTMIIESGLDIPSVNTLLVHRADTFGLAQLYQLRGRVGRSHHRAYAYFMVPERRVLTEDAEKRLKVIESFDELGAGFKIALKDMEIRGAGNLLGPEQHGFILGLGFDLYVKLLEETIADLKGVPHEERTEPRLTTDWPAFLPEDYVPDNEEKLELYRRLAVATRVDVVDAIREEIEDRFGKPPAPARHLLALRRIRLLGAEARCSEMKLDHGRFEMWLFKPLTPRQAHTLLTKSGEKLEFLSGREMGVRLKDTADDSEAFLERSRKLLQALVESATVPG
ncbi:MAG: transcription-repair coupling factor [Candidatus Eiseniibacteriota bacterium]